MTYQKRTPLALAGANGAEIIVSKQSSTNTPTKPECLAAAIIAKRHRLTFQHAQLICSLAGIGGVQ